MSRPFHHNDDFAASKTLSRVFSEKIGGPADTAALLTISGAALAATPLIDPVISPVAAAIAAIGSSIWLGRRFLKDWEDHFLLKSSIGVASSLPPMKPHEKSGLCLGYTSDKGEPLFIPDESLFRHMWIVGMSGVGKTVCGSLLMAQQIQRGGGVLFVDGKLDADNILSLYQFAVWCGRGHEFYVLNPGDPSTSNTYNPILDGDPDEVAARLLSLIPSTEGNAGSDFYKQSANQALTIIIGACQRSGLAYNFYDLAVILNNEEAMKELQNKLNSRAPSSDEAKNLKLFLDQYRIPQDPRNPLAGGIDMKRIKETLGGMAGRLFQFGTGSFGQILNTYTPEVKIYDAIRDGKIVYAALPTMGKDIAANNFGKMLLGDFRTAVSWLQRNKHDRPRIPFLCFFDEAASYVTESWAVIFEQARSAGIFLMPAIQTESGFAAVSDDFSERVIGNTTTRAYFRIGTTKTAELVADLIGKTSRVSRTTTESGGASDSQQFVQFSPQKSSSSNDSEGLSEREEEVHLVTPDQLKSMNIGEAVVQYNGKLVYNILIPAIRPSAAMCQAIGPLRLNHPRQRMKTGLNLKNRLDEFIQTPRTKKEEKKESSAV